MGQLDEYRAWQATPSRPSYDNFQPERLTAATRSPASAGARTLRLAVPEPWTAGADCLGRHEEFDADNIYPARARLLCAGCPVRTECLTAALIEERGASRRHGVRGGLTASERAQLDMSNDNDRSGVA